MRGAFFGWVALGAAVGLALGAGFVLFVAWAMTLTKYTGEPVDVGSGAAVCGGIGAVLGALVGAAAGIAGGWWPAEAEEPAAAGPHPGAGDLP